jgi:hypothetical protein
MITKENKNRIRWTDTYAEQYLNASSTSIPERLLSAGSSSSHFSFASTMSGSSLSQISNGSSDDVGLSWVPRGNREKDAESVSQNPMVFLRVTGWLQ